ncbi:MAG: ATP-grasp domain-containing protein [Alphaproteobacteria bacterium]|nr:ATP-grasp domain-containing protein [Alphaproteobacteria bacterium]
MKISVASTFIGPNIFSTESAIKYTVDVGAEAGAGDGILTPAFLAALYEHLPALEGRIAQYPGIQQRDSASLARLFMLVSVELQNIFGCHIDTGDVQPTASPNIYNVTYGYEDARVGLAAGGLAALLIQNLLPSSQPPTETDTPGFDFAKAHDNFIQSYQHHVMHIQHRYIIEAARVRGIPVDRLGDGLFVFGQGRFRKLHLRHFSDQTSHVGFVLSSNKSLTGRLLSEIGLPVPEQRVVTTRQQAVQAAEQIGYPVVLKPLDSDFGRGVSVGLEDSKSVATAFARAQQYRRSVLVESFIAGDDHRMLVINGKLIATAKRKPAHVTGDGRQTVEELIEEANRSPWRGIKRLRWLPRLGFDEETKRMLSKVGYERGSVPTLGKIVQLRNASNLSAGGTSTDVTDQVHPDNRELAISAAAAMGIDIAGVDFITPDISRSYREVGGAICELNTTPGLNPHIAIDSPPRDIAGPFIETMYPPGAPYRIPIAVITGQSGTADTARLLAHILGHNGNCVGLATSDGVWVGGKPMSTRALAGQAAAHMVLRNPMVDAAVFAISPTALLQNGIGFDGCDVAAIVDGDAPAGSGASSLGSVDLADALGVAIKAARDVTIINDADTLCRDIASRPRSGNVLPVGEQAVPTSLTKLMAGLGKDLSDQQRHSILFAAAMAERLGRSNEEIRDALASFDFESL